MFWGADFTPCVGVGLVLVAIALFLCIYKGKEKQAEKKKFSLKWIIFSLIAFFGNAGCTIVQKTQQLNFNGQSNMQGQTESLSEEKEVVGLRVLILHAQSSANDLMLTILFYKNLCNNIKATRRRIKKSVAVFLCGKLKDNQFLTLLLLSIALNFSESGTSQKQ